MKQMKITLLSVFAGGLLIAACGQNNMPPRAVKDAFTKKFNAVQKFKWELEDNEWEAEFNSDGKEMSASFDSTGNWLETETEIKREDVPAEVFKSVHLKYDGWKIKEIEKVEKPGFNGYEFELKNKETKTEIVVSDSGELISK